MMMAELVQGQASVAQPGTKDDFADTIRRVRQVKLLSGEDERDAFGPPKNVFACGAAQDFGSEPLTTKQSSCS